MSSSAHDELEQLGLSLRQASSHARVPEVENDLIHAQVLLRGATSFKPCSCLTRNLDRAIRSAQRTCSRCGRSLKEAEGGQCQKRVHDFGPVSASILDPVKEAIDCVRGLGFDYDIPVDSARFPAVHMRTDFPVFKPASRIEALARHFLPAKHQDRWAEEWQGELFELAEMGASRWQQTRHAFCAAARVGQLRFALRGSDHRQVAQ
jgi:hypothetical protein